MFLSTRYIKRSTDVAGFWEGFYRSAKLYVENNGFEVCMLKYTETQDVIKILQAAQRFIIRNNPQIKLCVQTEVMDKMTMPANTLAIRGGFIFTDPRNDTEISYQPIFRLSPVLSKIGRVSIRRRDELEICLSTLTLLPNRIFSSNVFNLPYPLFTKKHHPTYPSTGNPTGMFLFSPGYGYLLLPKSGNTKIRTRTRVRRMQRCFISLELLGSIAGDLVRNKDIFDSEESVAEFFNAFAEKYPEYMQELIHETYYSIFRDHPVFLSKLSPDMLSTLIINNL